MTHPISIQSLGTREAVADGLYRCLMGLDLNDRKLWDSAWCEEEDISFVGAGNSYVGKAGLDGLFARVGPLETQHLTSNLRVDAAEGGKTARLTAYCQNQHFRPGEGMDPAVKGLIGGGWYDVDLKDGGDGLWKIKAWTMHLLWIEGDMAVLGGP